jgi:hypothetical protein
VRDEAHETILPGGARVGARCYSKRRVNWFPDEISALTNAAETELGIKKKPNDDVDALTPVESLARALAPAPSFSDGLRQQFVHVLTQTEGWLRNFFTRAR